jgi:tetratricopeptide (TPR) repeat protein
VLNPNLAAAWLRSSWVRLYLGQPEIVIEHAAKAMRLSPLDPFLSGMQGATAFGHFFAGRYKEAAAWAATALREQPHYLTALRVSAASNALAEQMEDAQKAIAKLRQLDPGLRISDIGDRLPLRQSADLARYAEGLRKAGLPD